MKSLLSALMVLTASAQDCKYALQVLQLQDASSTFEDDMATMMASTDSLMKALNSRYPGTQYAISSFTDKPIPISGYGPFGGYQNVGLTYDFCYRQDAKFTSDPDVLAEALSRINCGAGADIPEAQLESMMYAAADKSVGWNREEYSKDGRPLVRIVIQITDAYPHKEGDAAGSVSWSWNYPRVYSTPDDFSSASSGGVGADDFCVHDQPGTTWKTWCNDDVWPAVYPQWAKIFHKIDGNETLTDEEVEQWLQGNATMGPSPMLDPTTVHPGSDWDPERCNEVEYPSVAMVANTLVEYNVFPVWLIAAPTPDQYLATNCPTLGYDADIPDQLQQCVKALYDEILTEMGVTGFVGVLSENSEDVVDVIMNAIGEVVQEVCLTTTTTSTSGTTGTTAKATSTTTTTAETTTAGGVAPVPPPAVPGEPASGSSTAVIAGAAAGGAAAVAAAGFFAYKKFGAGMMGKTGGDGLAQVQQVDVPESPLEREAMEEVTMDMFQ